MPRPSCVPCCNPSELARSDTSYKDAVLQILCEIAEGTTPPVLNPITPIILSKPLGVLSVNMSSVVNTSAELDMSSYETVNLQYRAASASSGAVVFEAKNSANSVWVNINALDIQNGYTFGSSGSQTNVGAGTFSRSIPVRGYNRFRVRCIGVGLGTALFDFVLSPNAVNTVFVEQVGGVIPGTGATFLGKAEDSPHVSGDTGVAAWGVRRDALDTVQTSNTGDYGAFIVDSLGRQITSPYSSANSYVYGNASVTNTTSTSLIAAPAGPLRNYISDICISNTGATTVMVTLQNGSGGPTIWNTIAVAGGVSNISLQVPIRTSAATALFFAADGSSTTVFVSVSGFTAL